MQLLREQGVKNTGQVRYAFLERTGNLGLFRNSEEETIAGESTFPDDVIID